MKTQMKDIKTQDGICDAFIAYPEDGKQNPAVLLLMDAFGLREWLYEMAKTIAAQGYYVLVPNLFYRIRRAPVLDIKFPVRPEDMPEIRNKMMPLIPTYNPTLAMQDAEVFLDFLSQQKQIHPGPIGVTGYCMGGGYAVRMAEHYPDQIAAVACFHAGKLATDAPDSPHLLLNKIKAQLYTGYADNDNSMPADQIERFNNALKQSGIRYEAELYTGASHGYTMADLPAYNEAALKLHWKKLFELLERRLQ